MSEHVQRVSVYALVYVALLALLAAAVGAYYVDLGHRLNIVVTLTISMLKTLLVLIFFMHLSRSTRLTWVFTGAALLWLGVLFVLTFSDYLTRPWLREMGR